MSAFKSVLIFGLLVIAYKQAFCYMGNTPVCGADHETYANLCALQFSGCGLLHHGECFASCDEDGNKRMSCGKDYVPVCGMDAVTYGNECRLKFYNIKKASDGPCNKDTYVASTPPRQCDCQDKDDRVLICSLNGVTFENQCVLNCSQQISQNFGACPTQCGCPKTYSPICGRDGRTYDNSCAMGCVGIKKYGKGPCMSLAYDCDSCSLVETPICGADGKNYRNLCSIKCKGTKAAHFGRCKIDDKPKDTCSQCSMLKAEICGTDGKSYLNECKCSCQGYDKCKKYSDGRCPDYSGFKCASCKGVISKVCGNKGETYDNMCYLKCAGDTLKWHGCCNAGQASQFQTQVNVQTWKQPTTTYNSGTNNYNVGVNVKSW
jgi:coxsackievirus/adenovirus receptor